MKKSISLTVILSILLTILSTVSFAGEMPERTVLFDFEDGSIQGWVPNTYAGTPADTTLEVRDLGENNKALFIDCSFSDVDEKTYWDPICISCNGTYDMTGCKAISFDVTLDISQIEGYGTFKTLGAAIDGNGKFTQFKEHAIAKTDIDIEDGELITIRCYSVMETEMTSASQLLVYVVGSVIDYSGPLYIDNISLVTDMNEVQDAEPITLNRTTPVERNGKLQVIGTNLCNEDGEPVQLKGMSYLVDLADQEFVNRAAFQALAYDWKCDLVRIAVHVGDNIYGDKYSGTQEQKDLIYKCIDYAIETGMYVMLDWHVMDYGDPLDEHNSGADAFFDEFSAHYKDVPNLIYEICNEPNGTSVTWTNNIKPYAERVIPVIRNNSPDSVVIVGTGSWSQDVDQASLDPLDFENIMYTVHFYVKTHKQPYRDKVSTALANGVAVFATEWGMTSHTGADGIDVEETEVWLKFLEDNNISWTNWSLDIGSGESSVISPLVPDGTQYGIKVYKAASSIPEEVSEEGYRYWKESDLTYCGQYIRSYIRANAVEDEILLPLEITDITVENGVATVTSRGGQGNVNYSFYLLSDGKIFAKSVYGSNTLTFEGVESGTYRLRVYAQDSSGKRVVSEINMQI